MIKRYLEKSSLYGYFVDQYAGVDGFCGGRNLVCFDSCYLPLFPQTNECIDNNTKII